MNFYTQKIKLVQKLVPVLAVVGLLVYSSCYKDNVETLYPSSTTCDTTTISFANDIQPILNTNCALGGCHNKATASGTVELEDYDGAKSAAQGALLTDINDGSMPQGGTKLSQCNINKISRWVNMGMPNN